VIRTSTHSADVCAGALIVRREKLRYRIIRTSSELSMEPSAGTKHHATFIPVIAKLAILFSGSIASIWALISFVIAHVFVRATHQQGRMERAKRNASLLSSGTGAPLGCLKRSSPRGAAPAFAEALALGKAQEAAFGFQLNDAASSEEMA
jgi:hypothetical protein